MDTTTDAFGQAQQAVLSEAGGPGGVQDNLPLFAGPSLEGQAQATLQRKEASTPALQLQSIWRQDGIVDGLIASYAGDQMVPDDSYSPFGKDEWAELSEGIRDDLLPGLYTAHSAGHARYLRQRLLDKQEDQQRLEDQSALGVAGRFAVNALMPDQLLAGMVGGRMAQVLKLSQMGRAAKAATAGPLLGGAAAGGASNAAFEAIRQKYNFEEDTSGVLEAGLMGAAIAVPFGVASMRSARRLGDTVNRERNALEGIRTTQAGHTPDPMQARAMEDALAQNTTVRDLEMGRITPEEAQKRLEDLHQRNDLIPTDDPVEAPPVPSEVPTDGFLARGSIGSGQVGEVASVADQATAFQKARYDIFATLNRSESPAVRRLAFSLVKDAIQVDKLDAQGWTASEWKGHLTRTIRGAAATDMRAAYLDAVKARGVGIAARVSGQFDGEFYGLVSRVTRGDQSVLAANPDIAPMLSKASAAMRKAYDELYAEAVAAGVKGTDQITPQDFYVNRQWHHGKMRDAERIHGRAAVEKLVAGAIRVPGLTGDVKKASRFLAAVRRLEFSPAMQDIMLGAKDMGTLRAQLADPRLGLSSSDVDSVVDTMFEAKARQGEADAGTAANLKYRFDLDENYSVQTPAGELRVSDLLENDARYLLDSYFNSIGGHTGLAKVGITSKADWDTRMAEVTGWFDSNSAGIKGDSAGRDVRYLNDIYSNITGRPMSTADFSGTARAAAAFRAYSRSIFLGQLGFASAFEMGQAMSLFGLRSLVATMPSLGGFLEGVRRGHIPSLQLARDISHMAGFGNEMAMSYARHAEVDDGIGGRALNAFEVNANKAAHAVDTLSGNASFTAMTRNWAGRMFVQKAFDWANDSGLLSKGKWRERMVGWGVNDDDLDTVLSKLKQHTTSGPNGYVQSIDYEGWLRDSPKTYESFQLAVSRAARDAVQDQDLGETAMFMHSTLGKFFGELKSFFLVAHAKNMLKNMSYRDSVTLQVWTVGFLGNALAYMTQTAANYAQDPDQLQKRLTLEAISKAAFFRMSAAGVAPLLTNMGYAALTGGDSLVQPGMTTNTDARSLVTPSMQIASRLVGAPQTLGGLLLGTDVTTQKEAKDLAGIIPGSRLLGISNGINYFSEMLPKSDPSKGQ